MMNVQALLKNRFVWILALGVTGALAVTAIAVAAPAIPQGVTPPDGHFDGACDTCHEIVAPDPVDGSVPEASDDDAAQTEDVDEADDADVEDVDEADAADVEDADEADDADVEDMEEADDADVADMDEADDADVEDIDEADEVGDADNGAHIDDDAGDVPDSGSVESAGD